MPPPTKRRKRIIIAGSIAAILLLSYTAAFARELRCHFVEYSDLREINEYLYVDPEMPNEEVTRIMEMLSEAKYRNRNFIGELQAAPVIIAGADENVTETYGSSGNRTAVTHVYFGKASIVLGPDGLNTDVIAHEMMHAELSERIGWLRKEMDIPTWFDEGLAMQVDHRSDYSEDAWQKETQGGKLAPALNTLADRDAFSSDDYWRSYATSKHEVMRWHSIVGRAGLDELLEKVEQGEEFEKTYRAIEEKYSARRTR